MRHGKKFNHLGRTASHRKAMLSNMATSLIIHKRINTTVAKAKALKKYVEPLITRAKSDSTHSRRMVFSYLQDKESVNELFGTVADKVAGRPGGYTRIIKTGARLGDNAEMCMMELVDFNELLISESTESKPKTRRSRRGAKSKKAEAPAVEESVVEDAVVEEEVKEEEPKAEEAKPEEEVSEETTDSAEDAAAEDKDGEADSEEGDKKE